MEKVTKVDGIVMCLVKEKCQHDLENESHVQAPVHSCEPIDLLARCEKYDSKIMERSRPKSSDFDDSNVHHPKIPRWTGTRSEKMASPNHIEIIVKFEIGHIFHRILVLI